MRALLDREQVTLGEPFTLTVEVVHDGAEAWALPDPLPLAPLTLRGSPTVVRERMGEGARTLFTMRLIDVATLTPAVPDLVLRVEGPQGARSFTVAGRPLKLVSLVDEERATNPERARHGPKPPIPVMVPTLLWAWLLLGAAGAVAAAVALGRLLRRRASRPQAVPQAPEDEALQRLAALRARAPWKRGQGRAAIFEVSETLRSYLGRRLAFDALDRTSTELLAALRERSLAGLDLGDLQAQLSWEDMVKFARLDPAPAECLFAIELAERIVGKTRPRVPTVAQEAG